ncbi:MAG: hypothetical protein GY913_33370 [Proteobacteria bacterium]|nr:hypothetical protein [Pseudomonadota bacterium]MCP4921817.1 hypothetical protein [Pseudomonadota bacterium]
MLLALCLTVLAQDPEDTTPAEAVEEAPVDEAPAEVPAEDGWEEAAVEEAAVEEAAVEEAAVEEAAVEEAVETIEAVAEEEAPESAGYTSGYAAGEEDAKRASDYALHGLAGFGAGCIAGPCGCVAVPAIEAVVVPGVPAGPWQSFDEEYKRGYIDGYRKKVQRRRIIYSLAGASVGTVLGVGTGLAFGVFIS